MRTIGVIGLGNMGRGMALSLRRRGFAVMGYDPAPAAREASAADGIEIADGTSALWPACDAVVLSLPTPEVVEAVLLGSGGPLHGAKTGLLVIDTSTSDPDVTRRISTALAPAGIDLIDAPVSGGPKGAHAATLTMVIGGSDRAVALAEPVLAAMSATRVHVGGVGAGHVTKLANNLLCAAHLITAAEAVRMAKDAGVDPERLLAGINAGSGRSGVTQVNFPTWVLSGAFDSGFTMKLMRKDVRLAENLVAALGLDLPLSQAAARLWRESADGIPDEADFNAIVTLQLDPNA
ncbi:3-hydroxyisobutyrate dehydrogenase [Methylobacterium frigidaeris]|uniref:2-(Hydroxymethyl)glutarate dehydrogenase n=1 Tax=Methylobacterium frigidaeris TaxID=2038277 RepID=A0AA37H7M3_9HYPH|nr:3-hydroxyisobutyrate dehydrogenase [Methylobacterium frigidaeris]GJD60886.1 2-(hydroxymethyl)glutarate dehydrogenase [Methylobacterium frigidaeris]